MIEPLKILPQHYIEVVTSELNETGGTMQVDIELQMSDEVRENPYTSSDPFRLHGQFNNLLIEIEMSSNTFFEEISEILEEDVKSLDALEDLTAAKDEALLSMIYDSLSRNKYELKAIEYRQAYLVKFNSDDILAAIQYGYERSLGELLQNNATFGIAKIEKLQAA